MPELTEDGKRVDWVVYNFVSLRTEKVNIEKVTRKIMLIAFIFFVIYSLTNNMTSNIFVT